MKNCIRFSLIGILAFILLSCEKAEMPMALFDYQIDGITVQFTNYSTDATTYMWDFGDGNTSTEENPLHVYAESGNYIITFTATGEGGSKTIKEMLKIQKPALIQIDGYFDDWDNVPAEALASVTTLDEESALKEMKATSDDNYIYIYLVLEESKVFPIDIFINADNNSSTGGNTWLWDPCGAEFLLEGFISANLEDVTVFNFPADAAQDDWAWTEVLGPGSGIIKMSSPKTINGDIVAIEMYIIKEMIPATLAPEIGIGIFSSDENWSDNGVLPNTATGDPAPLMTLKLQ